MGRPGIQLQTWTLCVLLSWICVGLTEARPQYMVTIPAVMEAGAETRFCVSLLQSTETVDMTVTLMSNVENTTLLKQSTDKDLHQCISFTSPTVQDTEVQTLEVEVRSNRYHSREVRKVMFKAYRPMTFIQTDKPIYLPGQTVSFRVLSMDTKFRPVNSVYNIIEIEDPQSNRIGQWQNETSDSKILQFSYSLNSEAREGVYQVIVTSGEVKFYHSFKVEKYVLPKFDVTLKVPDEVSIEEEYITVDVCAKYTFGQPVPGSVKFEMCRPLSHYIGHTFRMTPEGGVPDINAPCHKETKQMDKKGCATLTIKMSTFTKIGEKAVQDALDIEAQVEEEGTGISHQQGKRTIISYVLGKLSFIDTPKIYEEGSTVEGKVKAVYHNDTPIADKPLYLFEGRGWSQQQHQNLTTDSNGIATFSFSPATFQRDIYLTISTEPTRGYRQYRTPYYEAGEHTLSLMEEASPDTKSVSFLEVKKKDGPLPCESEEDISIKYTVAGEAQGSADLMYLILSRGAILMLGSKQIQVEDKPVTEGEVSFKLKVSPEMAPGIVVVAYAILPSETVMAHSADISTEKCFSHKVLLEFSQSSAVPGEESTMQLTAQPGSLCGVSAVDQSVHIKEPGKTVKADKIFDLLPVTKASYIPYEVSDSVSCMHVRPRRYVFPRRDRTDDAYTVFQNNGLKMATNVFIRVPTCLQYRGREYHYSPYGGGWGYGAPPVVSRMNIGAGSAPPLGGDHVDDLPPSPIVTVRSFFPETWIWDLVEIGESGTKDVPVTVPDTITTWETEAFCLSPHGFGLAPRKEFTVFQPFFLELSLPYSVIRGEQFELKATVFSYQSNCMMVTVTPGPSLDYNLTPRSGNQYTSCLCNSGRKTLTWTMVPTSLGVMNVTVSAEAVASQVSCDNEIVSVPDRGRIDVVTRQLIVKAEGTEMTKTHNWLFCPKEETLTADIDLKLPENVIDGSVRASISVLGDILGRALKNLDGMLQMPYGCGEQNMALLAPNIYILQYLKNTDQLTPAIKEKATNFLTSGYQRQLNYKHNNGAYSTFGTGQGNTWLTAFVLRSFAKAQSFIYIDPEKVQQTKIWLESIQRNNGCFEQLGRLFNNRMKGGVSDEVTLTAYVTATFLEMGISKDDAVVNKSLSCLRESASELDNIYTTALLAYVFTLTRDMETRAQLLEQLDKVSLKDGGFLHWSQSTTESSTSLSVEISSYVLLAKLSASPTTEDLGYTSRIVRWLTGQQNHYGGFSSTQDTVVALQALALYSTLVFSPEGSSTVTVQSPSSQMTFDVNQHNKLLYQEKTLQDVTGKYSLEVKGTTCAAMQISLHYNIPTPTDVTTLSVEVKPEATCSSTSTRPKLTLKLKSLYRGEQLMTNMVILDIKMLSGFVPNPESLKKLKGALLVDNVEQEEDHVLLYIRELPKIVAINHSLELIQEIPVQNLKPAVIKIYDYYQPSDQAEIEYTYPCA
ncbi:alpha-2-macroglobulin-like [Scomber japonicus]|uniref:alpha-2-macroglobulin-like n=1 Tax=Scomber japonicus TaxID=13676 RepID=UPI002305322F|nr:alpha-2-macroglobulin-like [Scomber japonicus]